MIKYVIGFALGCFVAVYFFQGVLGESAQRERKLRIRVRDLCAKIDALNKRRTFNWIVGQPKEK